MKTYRICDLPDRLAVKLVINPNTGCWEWQGTPTESGYGHVWWMGRMRPVHHVVFELLVGPIPEATPTLDHVYDWGCRSRLCCWPAHLEPVTQSINSIRTRGHCKPRGRYRRDRAAS